MYATVRCGQTAKSIKGKLVFWEEQYLASSSEIKFPNDTVQLHPDMIPFRPSPPRSQPPQTDFDSDNDSFVGDDVDLADDPFVRSHSILQVLHNKSSTTLLLNI